MLVPREKEGGWKRSLRGGGGEEIRRGWSESYRRWKYKGGWWCTRNEEWKSGLREMEGKCGGVEGLNRECGRDGKGGGKKGCLGKEKGWKWWVLKKEWEGVERERDVEDGRRGRNGISNVEYMWFSSLGSVCFSLGFLRYKAFQDTVVNQAYLLILKIK